MCHTGCLSLTPACLCLHDCSRRMQGTAYSVIASEDGCADMLACTTRWTTYVQDDILWSSATVFPHVPAVAYGWLTIKLVCLHSNNFTKCRKEQKTFEEALAAAKEAK